MVSTEINNCISKNTDITQEKTMTKLLKWIEKVLCSRQPYSYDLERYISKQQPKTVADVEYYTREYQKRKGYTL